MNVLKLVGVMLVMSLMSCGSSLEKHKNFTPRFDLFDYFSGETTAWGMVKDIKGNQINRFHVAIKGEMLDEHTLRLVEDFDYVDGEKQQRIWVIKKTAANKYVGTADDIIGEAKGQVAGNALRWEYTFLLTTKNGDIKLKVDDWMFLQDGKHLFNVTEMKKFGLTLATVNIFFQKKD